MGINIGPKIEVIQNLKSIISSQSTTFVENGTTKIDDLSKSDNRGKLLSNVSVNSNINFINDGHIELEKAINAKCISFWMSPSNTFISSEPEEVLIEDSNSNFRISLGNANTNITSETISITTDGTTAWNPVISSGEWVHIVFNYEGGEWQLYLDSVLQSIYDRDNSGAQQIVNFTPKIAGDTNYFKGLLDNIRFYDETISQSSINQIQQNEIYEIFESINLDFSADKTTIDQLEKVTFTANSNIRNLNYYWVIEDGSNFQKTGKSVDHTFRNTGFRTVYLTASNQYDSVILTKKSFIEVNIGQYKEFIFDIDTTKSGATANNEFQLPFVSNGNYSCSVDWGDGNTDVISSYNQSETLHPYSSGGVYTVKITGTFEGWSFRHTSNPQDPQKMIEIKQWGELRFKDNGGYFDNCQNMTVSATDNLDTSYLENFSYFFSNCQSLTIIPNIEFWDTSNAIYFIRTFYKVPFDQDLDGFIVDNVVSFKGMFYYSNFNHPIPSWNTPNVTDLNSMFRNGSFNQPVNHFKTGKVTDFGRMFKDNHNFNQPVDSWDVREGKDFNRMFANTSFNQDISNWEPINGSDFDGFIQGTPWSVSNYDKMLNAWQNLNLVLGVFFDAGSNQYSSNGDTAKTHIINNYNWTFNDGGCTNC
jgi:surface protein